jgi:hypothetical protein
MAVTNSGEDKILRWTRLYVGGYDLSGDSRTFSGINNTLEAAEMTGWSESVRNYLSAGMREVGLMGYQALMNDTTTTGAFTILKNPDVSYQLSMAFGGGGTPAIGDPAFLLPAVHMSSTTCLDSNAVVFNGDFLVDADQYNASYDNPLGVVLQPGSSLSSTLSASSTNTVDFESQTTGGWVAILHILATSSGNFAFKVRDSADDSSFADLVTFTLDGSAVGSEVIFGTGTVDQYVGFDAQRTGGSCTAVCTFARNI